VPALVSIFVKAPPSSRLSFALSCAARLLGWPMLALGLIGLPWVAFDLYVVPVLFDAYPISRSILAAPLDLTRWVVRVGYLILPILWSLWLVIGTMRLRNSWRGKQDAS
jgi:hypothetical protein